MSATTASVAVEAPAATAPDYDDRIVRMFVVASLFWALVGMSMGVFIAAQMVWPALNLDSAWTTFGRLRPVHTSGVIFAFGGNAVIGTSLYCVCLLYTSDAADEL